MSGALLKTPLRQVTSIQQLLMSEQARDQLKMVATKALTPERMMRVVANSIRRTPSLQDCEPMSFLGAMMFCAQMGLEPNTPLGLAYLVPFNKNTKIGKDPKTGKDVWGKVKQVEVVIGYKGFKELARRSGIIRSMHGDIVYEGDAFSHEYGTNQHLKHIPCGCNDKAKAIGAYFHVAFQGGEGHVYMTRAEIEAHRDRYSKGWQDAVRNGKTADSPWQKDWESMWIKTPCRRLFGRGDVPMSVELLDALSVDETPTDFSGFAFDPGAGPVIDADAAGDEDGDDTPMIEQQPSQQHDARMDADWNAKQVSNADSAGRQAVAEKPNQRRSTGAYAEGAPGLDEKAKASAKVAAQPEQASMFAEPQTKPRFEDSPWAKQFLQDVRDVGYEAAADLHSTQLSTLMDADRAAHGWLMEQVQLIEDAAGA